MRKLTPKYLRAIPLSMLELRLPSKLVFLLATLGGLQVGRKNQQFSTNFTTAQPTHR